MKMNGWGVLVYMCCAAIIHCVFLAFIFSEGLSECGNKQKVSSFTLSFYIIWSILFFPILLLFAFYTLCFRITRSFLCSCWDCCGNDVNGKHATKCKICFEGACGNPLLFSVSFIAFGGFEYYKFDGSCPNNITYAFLGDLLLCTIALLLICIYYFVRVRRRFNRKRAKSQQKKHNEDALEDAAIDELQNNNPNNPNHPNHNNNNHRNHQINENQSVELQINNNNNHNNKANRDKFDNYHINAPPRSNDQEGGNNAIPRQAFEANRRFSAYAVSENANNKIAPYNPNNNLGGFEPAYASSVGGAGVSPYLGQGVPAPRRHSYDPDSKPRNQNEFQKKANIQFNHRKKQSASIEISVSLDDGDAPSVVHKTRGASLSFPAEFKGHARRCSSGILKVLQSIDAEPECAVCMCELEKGDDMAQLECGHTFHKECIIEWLQNEATCPFCRSDMNSNKK